ncbi:MAG: 2-oxoglutarate dehydrogenase complex dihydrolipoyllysine-residue succinyltransferase, partial [Gemmatimonadetes bacterium]|nr:2-oxoglutarate dehydrogenase complex dihydrolipoyllysine-residue succinyltransferase [Gemmatimonadota bacterium]NIO32010.1 2-oxoglutarate dehydrogenase complex dihydrolipoyllysine-residue succinyltransferase [Gemmatimonadota bacterium]
MAIDILVPDLGESITEGTVATWLKEPGDQVAADEPLLELETDKATLEIPAPSAGILSEILVQEGEDVEVGALLGRIDPASGQVAAERPAAEAAPEDKTPEPAAPEASAPQPAATREIEPSPAPAGPTASPASIDLDPDDIPRSGPDGEVTLKDLESVLGQRPPSAAAEGRREERVRMSRLRRTVAARLKEAQNTAAILTTFNEADMSAVIEIRKRYRDSFEERYGVRLGFMSFFVKACVAALKEMPEVNAQIDGSEIVYKHYYDIGIAVSTDSGLKVPVIRDADRKSFAEIERDIATLAAKAREDSLALDEMEGGTFSISNGGVFGSLLSTPILNPPQSAILGLHKIEDRPVVIDGQVQVRPMMYLALSYD